MTENGGKEERERERERERKRKRESWRRNPTRDSELIGAVALHLHRHLLLRLLSFTSS